MGVVIWRHDSGWFRRWLVERDFQRRPDAYVNLFVRYAKVNDSVVAVQLLPEPPVEFYHGLMNYTQHPSPRVREHVVYAFAYGRTSRGELKASLLPVMAEWLQDADKAVVDGAVTLVGVLGSPAGHPVRQLVYSPNPRTRLAAARALTRVLSSSEQDRDDLRAIEHLINDENERVRMQAQYALRVSKGVAP